MASVDHPVRAQNPAICVEEQDTTLRVVPKDFAEWRPIPDGCRSLRNLVQVCLGSCSAPGAHNEQRVVTKNRDVNIPPGRLYREIELKLNAIARWMGVRVRF